MLVRFAAIAFLGGFATAIVTPPVLVQPFDGAGPISYTVKASNLTGPATGAHIHGPADATRSAGVIADLKVTADTLDGVMPSDTSAAGEIRAQVTNK